MKHIAILILLLLCIFSTTTFAQQVKTYEVSNCFTIDLPKDWQVHFGSRLTKYHTLLLAASSPNSLDKKLSIIISLYDRRNQNVDDFITDYQMSMRDYYSYNYKSYVFEDSDTLYIDNCETKFLLYSYYDEKKGMEYASSYFVFASPKMYKISSYGDYGNLEADRKIIDEIIASIKTLK